MDSEKTSTRHVPGGIRDEPKGGRRMTSGWLDRNPPDRRLPECWSLRRGPRHLAVTPVPSRSDRRDIAWFGDPRFTAVGGVILRLEEGNILMRAARVAAHPRRTAESGVSPMVLPGPGLRDITIARLWQFAAEKSRRDDRAQDLRGPATDREHTRIAHHSFERSIARIACRAE